MKIGRVGMLAAVAGMMLFGLGGTAFASTGLNGPTPPQLGDPVAGSNEVATVRFTGTVTGGTYTLSFNGSTTAALAYNAASSVVQTALTGLASIGSGNATVSGSPSSPSGMAVTFVGALGNQNVPDLTGNFSALTGGGTGAITIVQGAIVAAGSQISPHGGYSSTTNFCLQCHGVHTTVPGTTPMYGLMWQGSVTATCNTCHALPAVGSSTTNPRDSNAELQDPPGLIMGTASLRSAYDISTGVKATHPLNATNTNDTGDDVTMMTTGWSYGGFNAANWTANQKPDGLQCSSCHTAHGDFGRLVNSPNGVVRTTANEELVDPTGDSNSLEDTQSFAEGTAIYFGRDAIQYLHLDADPRAWEACTTSPLSPNSVVAVAGGPDTISPSGTCSYLQTTDSEGQTVSLYGYKLLSAYPNNNWTGGGESWGLDNHTHDQARWCGSCHPAKVASQFGGTYHNHPTGCTSCHGNPSADPTSRDFPHTSTFAMFLTSYPDGLCIGRCHTSGSLP